MSNQSDNDKVRLSRKKYEDTRVKLTIRFKPEEMKLVVEFAEKSGMPIATYIHDIALNPKFKITPPRPRINTETKALIQRMGINFNQITRSMNNYYEAKNFDRISLDLGEIARTLREILDRI
jgi:hypothetical protein